MINRSFQFRLAPTASQEGAFAQFSGVCRLVYNVALEQRKNHNSQFRRARGKSISYVTQASELTEMRSQVDWVRAVHVTPQQQALRDLDVAFKRFFGGVAKFPTPRKKGANETFRFQGREIVTRKLNRKWAEVRLPKIGWVRYRGTREVIGKVNNVTIKQVSGSWIVVFSLSIEHEVPNAALPRHVGVDRGVAQTIALSTGEMKSVPSSLAKIDKKIAGAQRSLSRKTKGSARYACQKRKISQLHSRKGRIRRDWHHKISADLANRFGAVIIEALNTKGMTASSKGTMSQPGRMVKQKSGLNRAILNQGWYIFETLLQYKLEERGGVLLKVPAQYTSQTCSQCGVVDRKSRESQSSFSCQHCGHQINSDHNAAINILRRNTASMDMEAGSCPAIEVSTISGPITSSNPMTECQGRC